MGKAIGRGFPLTTMTLDETTLKPTSILHRTPWRPPVAVSGKGIYIQLEDGRTLIDAIGGAAVSCIGNGHPVVQAALKEQIDKVSCINFSVFSSSIC